MYEDCGIDDRLLLHTFTSSYFLVILVNSVSNTYTERDTNMYDSRV